MKYASQLIGGVIEFGDGDLKTQHNKAEREYMAGNYDLIAPRIPSF
jgi:hypothetical protein